MKKSLLKLMSDYCYITGNEAKKMLEWYLGIPVYQGDVYTNLNQMVNSGLIERKKNFYNRYVYKLVTNK